MGNIDTYVKEHGGKTFSEEPFGDVDNLVLSYLVYYDFREIVPEPGKHASVTVAEAARQYEETIGNTQKTVNPILLRDMAESERFANLRLSGRVDIFSKMKTQFSSLCVTLPDGTPYFVFRGIDYSVTGWMEAFQTSYMETPAQKMAAKYLKRMLDAYGEDLPEHILLGGHSKGGNLALYAAVHQEKDCRDRIVTVYQNDAPGLPPFTYSPRILAEFKGRVQRLSPSFCVLDSLYKDSFPDRIIRSDADGFKQHEPFCWAVEGTDFVDAEADPTALKLRLILSSWIASLHPEECRQFTQRFFGIWQKKEDGGGSFDITKTADIAALVLRTWVGASLPVRRAMLRLVKSAIVL